MKHISEGKTIPDGFSYRQGNDWFYLFLRFGKVRITLRFKKTERQKSYSKINMEFRTGEDMVYSVDMNRQKVNSFVKGMKDFTKFWEEKPMESRFKKLRLVDEKTMRRLNAPRVE